MTEKIFINLHKTNKLITVIGSGGNRGVERRKEIGVHVSNSSDLVIFTEDNSRSEKTIDIIGDLTKDIKKKNYIIEENRKTHGNNPAGLDYLKFLGISHVQILPVHDYANVDDLDFNNLDESLFLPIIVQESIPTVNAISTVSVPMVTFVELI